MRRGKAAYATASIALVAMASTRQAQARALAASNPMQFVTLPPCRVIDTRAPAGPLGGPALVAGADRVFPVAGTCGIPLSAKAISANIAVTSATAPGNLRLHPGGSAVPLVSSINYSAAQARSNNALVSPNDLGELAVFVGAASGTVHLILDVNGFFATPARLVVSAGAIDFGSQDTGVTSGAVTRTITNTGDLASGTLLVDKTGPSAAEFTLSGDCSGAVLAPSATCDVGVSFAPVAGGSKTATVTVSADAGGSAPIDLSGNATVRLTVAKAGAGAGSVTSIPAGIDCGGACAASYDLNTPVTLQARTANGSNSFFSGWSGGGCSGSFRDCTVTMDAARAVTATFSAQTHNLVFVTSGVFPANLGGIPPYDAACNMAASAAGINNAAGGAFIAWMSTSTSTAQSRFGPVRGWVRTDGAAFADSLSALLGQNQIFSPIALDEDGRDVAGLSVWTGTPPNGSIPGVTQTCTDWTNAGAGITIIGNTLGGPGFWTYASNLACNGSRRVYCFGRTKNVLLSPTTAGKKIWTTNTAFTPSGGRAAANALCSAEKPVGVASSAALLATETVAAGSVLNSASTYVRVDGQRVGTGAELLSAGTLPSGIWQSANGIYVQEPAWTGHTTLDAPGTTTSTCASWTSTSPLAGRAGLSNMAGPSWWSAATRACSTAGTRIYCVEQ